MPCTAARPPKGVEVSPTLADRLEIYARLLVEWNEKII